MPPDRQTDGSKPESILIRLPKPQTTNRQPPQPNHKSGSIPDRNRHLSVSFNPDGKRIVSGSVDNTLKDWDAQLNKQSTKETK